MSIQSADDVKPTSTIIMLSDTIVNVLNMFYVKKKKLLPEQEVD
jgi:hypothetical protein